MTTGPEGADPALLGHDQPDETLDDTLDEEVDDADVEDTETTDAPAGDAQPSIESPVPTGDPRVDEAVSAIETLDDLPTSEHADVFEDVHRRLHTALTELDTD